jgi:hypothetical protein
MLRILNSGLQFFAALYTGTLLYFPLVGEGPMTNMNSSGVGL